MKTIQVKSKLHLKDLDMNVSKKESLDRIRQIGETVSVEFKRCGGNIEHDVYETVCSFSNRFGGDIYLGILDDGTVNGVPEKLRRRW